MEHPELPSIQSRIQILLNQASVNVQPRKQTLDGTSIVQETLQLYQKKYAGETLPDKKQYIATGGVKESHGKYQTQKDHNCSVLYHMLTYMSSVD